VKVHRRAGESAVVDELASLLRRRDATLARQGALFGSGADESRLFAIGPSARELVGRRVDSVPLEPGRGVRAELDQRGLLAAVDLDSGVVPARITGAVEGKGGERPLELAVAVNGRIEAVTQTFELDGTTRFSALVPEAGLRDGANEVEIFSLSDDGGAMRLTRLGDA
jgi:hypothetical protein